MNNILHRQPHVLMLQIITFLQQNAHPRVAERVPSVPENVTEQVFDLNIVWLHACMHARLLMYCLFSFSDYVAL